MCLRKVFSHEVRNILQFKSHKELGADGKARYPLPPEGQPINLPAYLGGRQIEDPEHGRKSPGDVRYWDEGWYLWKSTHPAASIQSMTRLPMNLPAQQRATADRIARSQTWDDYQTFLKSGQPPTLENRWLGPVVPPSPVMDATCVLLSCFFHYSF